MGFGWFSSKVCFSLDSRVRGNDGGGREGWVLGCVVGGLGCPSRLSAPVTLTLALSRRAGEGENHDCHDGE